MGVLEQQGECSKSVEMPRVRPNLSEPPQPVQAALDKVNMHWTSHMDQYDVLSHPQSQSLLPYLISSQPREDTILRQKPSFLSSPGSEARPLSSPMWTPKSSRGVPLRAQGSLYKDPNWRSQQISYLHSTQKARFGSSSKSDPYGAVGMAPDEQGNPRHFHWYQRERLAPGTPLRSMPHPYSSQRYARRPFDYAHRAQIVPPPLRQTPPAEQRGMHEWSSMETTPIPGPGHVPLPAPVPGFQPTHLPSTSSVYIPAHCFSSASSGSSSKPLHAPMRVLPESSFSVAPELLEDLDPTSLPPIQTEQVIDRVPRSLHSLFEPEGTRDQPHLDHLRERKRKLEEAFASGDLSLSEDAPMIIQEAKYRRKSSNQGLLSDAEKKANHIASEQKRRANIRKGYDMLASVLPSLERSTIEESRVSADEMGGENRSAAYSEIAVLLEGMLLRTSVCHFYSHLFLSPFLPALQSRPPCSNSGY